jgi:type III secretory pathway component EscS
MFALMIGLVAYTLVQDQSLKLALIVVAAFDMLAATYLVAKAFRQK